MQLEIPQRLRSFWNRILPIALFALLLGAILAFGDYVRQYTATQSFRRQMSHQMVQIDTKAAMTRRFLHGAAGGAVLGLLVLIWKRATHINGEPS